MEDSRYNLACRLVRQAARLLPACGSENIDFQQKTGHSDIVSHYDKLVETYLAENIAAAFPEDGMVGEEMPHPRDGAWIWYIDPIDGTTNFVNQQKNYAISVGCYHCGEPAFGIVLDVAENKLYHAKHGEGAYCNGARLSGSSRTAVEEMILYTPIIQSTLIDDHPLRAGMRRLAQDVRAVRSLGSVALELCALAAGEADLFLAARSCPWDHNAARIILAETGGALCTWEAERLPVDCSASIIAAGKRETLERILALYLTE